MPPTLKRSPFLRGVLTCAAVFAFGGLVLWGLFQAPRAKAPASPDVAWGVPGRRLRFVTLDCGRPDGTSAALDEIVAAVRPLDPDFVLLQRVRSEHAVPLAEALLMQRSFHPRFFRALGTRPRGAVGCLVLSRRPLFDAQALVRRGGDRPCFGVWAVSAVEGVRFAVASARVEETDGASPEELRRHWEEAASPPVVAGVASEGRGTGPGGWTDVVRPFGSNGHVQVESQLGTVLAHGAWKSIAGGKTAAPSGLSVSWVDLAGGPGPMTRPAG